MVINAEKSTEQFTAGTESRSGIRNKENYNDECSKRHENSLIVLVSYRKIIGNCNRTDMVRVVSEFLCHNEPIKISTYRKTDNRPTYIRSACKQSESRQTHKQITAHIRSLRTHSGNERTEFSASQIEIIDIFCLF